MNFRVYEMDGTFVGEVQNARSFVWTRRFSQPGAFDATLPLTMENIRLCALDRLVWFRGATECCLIENRVITDSGEEKSVRISGRDVICYLDRRLLVKKYNNNASVAVREVLGRIFTQSNKYMIPITGLSYRDNPAITATLPQGYSKGVDTPILTIVQELATDADCGARSLCDLSDGNADIVVELYNGVNRSAGQSAVRPVIFSPRYGNLERASYTLNNVTTKNVAIIRGRYGTVYTDEQSGETWTGWKTYTETVYKDGVQPDDMERRETFMWCSFEGTSEEMTLAKFRSKMRQEAEGALKGRIPVDSIDCDVLGLTQFVYRRDWDVGDIVTIQIPEWGIDVDKRVTEVQEVYEQEGMRVVPTFGEALPSVLQYRRR